jgi:hypothetical protein
MAALATRVAFLKNPKLETRGTLMTVTRVEWLLRLAVAGAFVGHGAYGAIVGKSSWFAYFASVGIPESLVKTNALMTVVGAAEVAAGLFVLVLPIPALLVAMAGWKIFTELLRPIAGELGWEFVERASNLVAPVALAAVVLNRQKAGAGSAHQCAAPKAGVSPEEAEGQFPVAAIR